MARPKRNAPPPPPLAIDLDEPSSAESSPVIAVTGKTSTEAHSIIECTNRIHTYFSSCDGIAYEPELRLLILWQQHLADLGYTPVVLNQSHAQANPRYAAYLAKVDTFHSVNPRDYERACWLRHAAMEQVGGGVLCDYDVFPSRLEAIPVSDKLSIFESGVPSLISGTSKAFGGFCDFLQAMDGHTDSHWSDMLAVREFPGMTLDKRCVQFTDTDWMAANFTHFSHSSTEKHRPRHKHILPLLALKEAA